MIAGTIDHGCLRQSVHVTKLFHRAIAVTPARSPRRQSESQVSRHRPRGRSPDEPAYTEHPAHADESQSARTRDPGPAGRGSRHHREIDRFDAMVPARRRYNDGYTEYTPVHTAVHTQSQCADTRRRAAPS